MDSSQIALIAVLAVVLIAAIVVLTAARKRKSRALADKFGAEYHRTVAAAGTKKAEKDLEERTRRMEAVDIRVLTSPEKHRYAELWRVAQERFVDSPSTAVSEADTLVTEVMRVRGYPMGDFETRAGDLSVDHPHLVKNYRAARALADNSRDGKATTEDLRQAMVHYRELFEELLLIPAAEPEPELVRH